jgi:predicted RNA-binding protein with RPS1 domain
VQELVNKVNDIIKSGDYTLVLGLDCEGISKDRPLSLIQISVRDEVYVIDLFQVNPFHYGLQEIMENPYIVKVFHDFCEDSAALVKNYGVYCQRVFDTQIAHRMLAEATNLIGGQNDFSQSNVGLNQLLKQYLNKANDQKDFIQKEMRTNKQFWEIRPLSKEMLDYASQDVIYLPVLYNAFCYIVEQYKKNNGPGSIDFEIDYVFDEAMKCNEYAQINYDIQKLKCGDTIQAFIKNIQKFGVYCSLNLGITGFINHKKSRKYIFKHHQIGDIVDVRVDSIQKKQNKVLIRLLSCSENAQFEDPPEQVYDEPYIEDFSAVPENTIFNPETGMYEVVSDYQDAVYHDYYLDGFQPEHPLGLSHSESFDGQMPNPEHGMLYSQFPREYNSVQYFSPELGSHQNYQNDTQNTVSTTHSYQQTRKLFAASKIPKYSIS